MVTRREKISFLQCTVTGYITILQGGSRAQEYLANTKETPWVFFWGGGIFVGEDMCFDSFSLFEREKEKINLGG